MIEQEANGYRVRVLTADELGGYPMTGKNDMGIIEVYNSNGQIMDTAWVAISRNGIARIERT